MAWSIDLDRYQQVLVANIDLVMSRITGASLHLGAHDDIGGPTEGLGHRLFLESGTLPVAPSGFGMMSDLAESGTHFLPSVFLCHRVVEFHSLGSVAAVGAGHGA